MRFVILVLLLVSCTISRSAADKAIRGDTVAAIEEYKNDNRSGKTFKATLPGRDEPTEVPASPIQDNTTLFGIIGLLVLSAAGYYGRHKIKKLIRKKV